MASRELQAQCEKAARSVVRGRMLIGAEQYEAAAAAAKAAHGETSFVTVTLALKASEAHFALAREPVTPADRETAWANGSTSWMVADAALRVRAAAGTLLPPSCSPGEAAFKAWFANALQCASGGAPFPPALASQLGAAVGYAAAWQSSYLAAIWMHPGLFGSTFSVSEHARKLGEASMLYALSLAPLSRTFLVRWIRAVVSCGPRLSTFFVLFFCCSPLLRITDGRDNGGNPSCGVLSAHACSAHLRFAATRVPRRPPRRIPRRRRGRRAVLSRRHRQRAGAAGAGGGAGGDARCGPREKGAARVRPAVVWPQRGACARSFVVARESFV